MAAGKSLLANHHRDTTRVRLTARSTHCRYQRRSEERGCRFCGWHIAHIGRGRSSCGELQRLVCATIVGRLATAIGNEIKPRPNAESLSGCPLAFCPLSAPVSEGVYTVYLLGGTQALTPLTIGRSSAKAGLFGALWGFGHSTGQLILGLGLILLKERFESFLPTLSRWGGVTVGGSLVFIGLSGLFELWKEHREAESVPEPSLAGVILIRNFLA